MVPLGWSWSAPWSAPVWPVMKSESASGSVSLASRSKYAVSSSAAETTSSTAVGALLGGGVPAMRSMRVGRYLIW
jgi:hypothetical protein